MSRHRVRWRSRAQDLRRWESSQHRKIEGKNRWRDKRRATCGCLCGCKWGRFSGGTGYGPVARFADSRVFSICRRVAAPVLRLP